MNEGLSPTLLLETESERPSRQYRTSPYTVREYAALRAVGATVLHLHQLKNCCDLLVGYRGRTHLMEIKDPAQPPSKRQLTPGEAKFRDEWKGTPYHVVETIDQAIKIITA